MIWLIHLGNKHELWRNYDGQTGVLLILEIKEVADDIIGILQTVGAHLLWLDGVDGVRERKFVKKSDTQRGCFLISFMNCNMV